MKHHWLTMGQEVLWLCIVSVVPLIVLPDTWMFSESLRSHFEIPKVVVFRVLVVASACLVLIRLSLTHSQGSTHAGMPTRWLCGAVIAYGASVLLSAAFSVHRSTSFWGDVPAQYGYSAYTLLCYPALFFIVSRGLRSQSQLRRLLAIVLGVGVATSAYAIAQRFGLDPLQLAEPGSQRASSTFSNPVFASGFLVQTTLLSMGAALYDLQRGEVRMPRLLGWLTLLNLQWAALIFTGTRGGWLLGVPVGVAAYCGLAAWVFGRTGLLRCGLLIASMLVVAAGTQFTRNDMDADSPTEHTSSRAISERISELEASLTERGLSHRPELWQSSLQLSLERPWFEFLPDSASRHRDVLGYGPDTFKAMFPLASARGGLLRHAHNFWLHHWVEQGFLGLISSLALFVAALFAGYALLRKQRTHHSAADWVAIALIATIVGRAAEMLVGVAREPDLVVFWVCLAALAAVPRIFHGSQSTYQLETGRTRMLLRATAAGLGIASLALISWEHDVNRFRAGVAAAAGEESFRRGDLRLARERFLRARELAPRTAIYGQKLAVIYATQQRIVDRSGSNSEGCVEAFSLEPGSGDSAGNRCLWEAQYANQRALDTSPLSARARLRLANSSLDLALAGETSQIETALRSFREVTEMIPFHYPLQNARATCQLSLGQPAPALDVLGRSLELSGPGPSSAHALLLQGLAFYQLERDAEARRAFGSSFEASATSEDPQKARVRLLALLTMLDARFQARGLRSGSVNLFMQSSR